MSTNRNIGSENLLNCKDFQVTQMTQELMIKKETEEVFEEKVDADNDLDRREFEDTITPERAIKSEKGEVFEIQKVKIEVENDDKKVFAVNQIANVFIKDEYGHCIDTDAADTVSDRTYNIHDTKANIDHSFMSFEGSNEQVFEMQEEEIMQKSVDNKYDVTGSFDQVIIKTEDDVQRFTDENTGIVLNSCSTKDEPAFTNPWIKSEAGEELRLDNDLDIETEINKGPIIKNEDDHILKHPRSELNMCIHCNVTFTIKRSLDDHIIRLHPDLIAEVSSKIHACSHCNYRTTRRERLVQHMLKHPGLEGSYKLLQCDHCDGEFRYKTILDDHIIQKHPDYTALVSSKIYECKDCAFKTTLKRNLDTHMRKHSEADGGGQLKTCIHCNATFTSKKSLDDHIIKKHPDYIASVSTKIHKCKYCEFKTTLKRDIDRHMRKHPEADEGGCQLEMCIHCNERFTSKKSLDDHVIKKHPEYIASVSSKIHKCKYCVFQTTLTDRLARHMGKHAETEDKHKMCIHCHKTFACKKDLDDHVISHKLNTCTHCNVTFKKKVSLDDHILRKHPDLIANVSSKIYACAHCTHRSVIKESLVRHMLKHPGAEGDYKLHKCVHCNGAFRLKSTLENHIIKKHPEHISFVSSKIYECKYCTFKTTSSGHLYQHMGAGGGCQNKTCIHCNATFKYKTNLDDHILKKHPEYSASVSSKIHECKYCVFKTAIKGHLVSHMSGKHPEAHVGFERKTCSHCNATFTYKRNLDDHIIEKHPEHTESVSSKVHKCINCTYKTTLKAKLNQHMLKHPNVDSSE